MLMCAFDLMALGSFRTNERRSHRMLRVAVASAAVLLVSVLLTTANGTPGAPFFRLLSALPFGWLFTNPGRFLFVAALGYASLIAVLVDQSPVLSPGRAATHPQHREPFAGRRRVLGPALLCAIPVVSGFPPLTGSVSKAGPRSSARRANSVLDQAGVGNTQAMTIGTKENRWS